MVDKNYLQKKHDFERNMISGQQLSVNQINCNKMIFKHFCNKNKTHPKMQFNAF